MFRIKQKLDNIYDLIISLNNNERQQTKAAEVLMRSYEKSNIELTKELESEKEKNKILDILTKSQAEEIIRLIKIIEDDKKFKDDIKEYLKTVATIATNIQKKNLSKKINATAYTRNNMTDETKAKLK